MDDFMDVMEMTVNFIKESPYSNVPIDESKVADVVVGFMTSPNEKTVILAVDEKTNEAVGLISGCISEHLFNRERTAFEVTWWVKPEHRGAKVSLKLFGALEYWARKMGCSYIQFGAAQGTEYSDKVAKLYVRNGYIPTEATFLKAI